ncbi:MAG TPA: hypothetical protein VGM63_01745 [Mucilaginibacter sp.]|jgi:hypothetical protein
MKKILFPLVCALLLSISCKKNTSPPLESSISASIDGVDETFNVNVSARQTSDEETGNTIMISGTETSESGSGHIDIEVNLVPPIVKGTYPIKTGPPPGFVPTTSVSYFEGFETFWPTLNAAIPNLITISHISSTNVQGTFSATVTLSGGYAEGLPTTKTITNGKFNVNIKQSN